MKLGDRWDVDFRVRFGDDFGVLYFVEVCFNLWVCIFKILVVIDIYNKINGI